MKKVYQNPAAKVIKLHPETLMIGASVNTEINDSNKGDFQFSRRRLWSDDEEE